MAFNNMKNQKSSFVESFTKKSYWIEKKLLKIYLKEIRKLRTKVKMDFSSTVIRENIFIDKIVLLAIESCV